MSEFATLGRQALNDVSIGISAPFGFPGSVWNQGETAYVRVSLRNAYDLVLRDVSVRFSCWGAAHNIPVFWFPNPRHFDEIDPGEAKTLYFVVRAHPAAEAHGATTAQMSVFLSAEPTPNVSRSTGLVNYSVAPA